MRRLAWECLEKSDVVATAPTVAQGVAYAFDQDEDFAWYCKEMLRLCSVDWRQLDLPQIVTLLFRAENSDGLLVSLQFPPLPPGTEGEISTNESDPYFRVMAALAFNSGDWYAAKQAMDSMRYDEVLALSNQLAELAKESKAEAKGGRGKPPKPPKLKNMPSDASALDMMRARAEAMRRSVENTAPSV